MLIPFKQLKEKYNINPIGVLHVGASTGQEIEQYYSSGVKKTVWVEAIPAVFEKLKANISDYPNSLAINACVADIDGLEVDFNISSNEGESSSILEFGTHSEVHPDVTFIDKIKMKTKTLYSLISENNINLLELDMLNFDLQGCELLALKGLGERIIFFKYIYLEVNEKELYKGCALVGEIDSYLDKYGFVGVECKMTGAGWGDKFYIHKDYLSNNAVVEPVKSVKSNNSLEFKESDYLEMNPDVAEAVKTNMFTSGFDHYQKHGKAEGRMPCKVIEEVKKAEPEKIIEVIERVAEIVSETLANKMEIDSPTQEWSPEVFPVKTITETVEIVPVNPITTIVTIEKTEKAYKPKRKVYEVSKTELIKGRKR